MSRDASFKKYFDKRGASIYIPTRVLEEMGLPTEAKVIEDAEVYLHVTLFDKNGKRLGDPRTKRLLPAKSIYWPTQGEPIYPSHMRVRVHLRWAV